MTSNFRQKGFSLPLIILMIFIIGAAGAVAFFVYSKNQSEQGADNKTTNSSQSQSDPEKTGGQEQKTANPTDSWITFTSEAGKFSLKYPPDWKLPPNIEYCSSPNEPWEGFFTGPTEDTVGMCQSDKPSQISIRTEAGDSRKLHDMTEYPNEYEDLTKDEVSVQGVSGFKTTGVHRAYEHSLMPEGTKMVRYIFYVNGRTYWASYYQQPTFPDNLDVFETMITKTLRFSE